MASSSSSSRQLKHQVFLSFRGEDTRHNFTSHLLKALKDKGLNVFFDEETLEKGEELSQALSKGIAASNISIIVLSIDYASSKSCLAELYEIMNLKRTERQIALPIFYHVNPSDVRNLGGSFKTSFDEHQSKRPYDQVRRWKIAFAEVGKLKGWHIEGGNFDRSETEYIKDIVEYVIKKLNSKSGSGSEELFGIDDQKEKILSLIEKEDSRVIGIWGMGGIGKTTLAEAVYYEVSPKFDGRYFLQNLREKLEKQGMESLRNELLSELLNQKNFRVDTPSIEGSPLIQERLNNKRVFVVLDDVNDSDLVDYFGVQHFGHGSKIFVTSRDQQVLKNVVDKIHEVKKLNEDDSLQLFSKFAFKQLNPVADFRDLSNKFVKYAQGNPLALKVLGPTLYQKPRAKWESELEKLKDCPKPKIVDVLKISFDELDKVDKDIFLDIACFFNRENKDFVIKILSCCYNGALCGISNLVDKCLLDGEEVKVVRRKRVPTSMHDLLQEMGRDIVREEYKDPGKRSRLWSPKDVYYVLKHNKGTESIEGIMLDMTQIDPLWLDPTIFKNMHNLRFLKFSFPKGYVKSCNKWLLANQVDIISLPDELRCLWWEFYPFKSLSSSFNLKNLVVLRLCHSNVEQLWNEDHQDLVNLREIDLYGCKNLTKIPSLLRAINLESLICNGCESLVELPCLNHLTYLKMLDLYGCYKLKKFPEVPCNFSRLNLQNTGIEEVPDSIEHLPELHMLIMINSRVKNVSSNISKLKFLHSLNLSHCPIVKFPKIPRSLTELNLSGTQIKNVPSSISRFKSLQEMQMNHCKSLRLLSKLPPCLQYLDAHDCTSLEKVSFTDQYLYQLYPFGGVQDFIIFSNCFNLNQDSIDNIVANAMLRIGSLAKHSQGKYANVRKEVFCCLSGNEISANKFEYQSTNSSIVLKIGPNTCSGSRFLVFALCIVADLKHRHKYQAIDFICEYQLKATGGDYEKFKSEWRWYKPNYKSEPKYLGDHMLILFSGDMVKKDKDYEEASFEFYIKTPDYIVQKGTVVDDIKVEKCGVHVFYVDAESYTDSAVESSEEFFSDEMGNDESNENFDIFFESNENFDSEEDANVEEVHDDSTTK